MESTSHGLNANQLQANLWVRARALAAELRVDISQMAGAILAWYRVNTEVMSVEARDHLLGKIRGLGETRSLRVQLNQFIDLLDADPDRRQELIGQLALVETQGIRTAEAASPPLSTSVV